MKPRAFDYCRPDSVDEALAVLAELGEQARIVAGGQSLMAMLNLRLLDPGTLIDIGQIKELSTITLRDGWLEVGAAVTQARLLAWPELARAVPLLARALPNIGHFQTRNRGTVGGSVSHADPSSELPLVLATLGGEVVLRSRRGSRKLAAAEFQTGMLSTARAADELLVAVRFPARPGGAAFREVARRHGDFAIVAVAAVTDGQGVRVGVGGIAEKPAVRTLPDCAPDALVRALNEWAWQLGGNDDVHASARYRRDLLRRLGPVVIEEARACAA